jgi:hypothetical protein
MRTQLVKVACHRAFFVIIVGASATYEDSTPMSERSLVNLVLTNLK